jgi:hypothetical protein
MARNHNVQIRKGLIKEKLMDLKTDWQTFYAMPLLKACLHETQNVVARHNICRTTQNLVARHTICRATQNLKVFNFDCTAKNYVAHKICRTTQNLAARHKILSHNTNWRASILIVRQKIWPHDTKFSRATQTEGLQFWLYGKKFGRATQKFRFAQTDLNEIKFLGISSGCKLNGSCR